MARFADAAKTETYTIKINVQKVTDEYAVRFLAHNAVGLAAI